MSCRRFCGRAFARHRLACLGTYRPRWTDYLRQPFEYFTVLGLGLQLQMIPKASPKVIARLAGITLAEHKQSTRYSMMRFQQKVRSYQSRLAVCFLHPIVLIV